MALYETLFTTGDVARICKVAPRTATKWFDSGRLRGYRIPGSRDRRIPREHLISFMQQHGMPLGELRKYTKIRILFLLDLATSHIAYEHGGSIELKLTFDAFSAGLEFAEFSPDYIVLDFDNPESEAVLEHIKDRDVLCIGLYSEGRDPPEALRPLLSERFRKPFDPALLFATIQSLVK